MNADTTTGRTNGHGSNGDVFGASQVGVFDFVPRIGFREYWYPALEAKLVDSGENLVVLIPDDIAVFYRTEQANNRLACTNAVQTYVDLAHAGGRGEEAAEAILQQRLRPAWSVVHNESRASAP